MELDEMKAMWAEHDRKLDMSLRLNRQLLNENHLNRAKSGLQRMVMGLALEAVINMAAIVALGNFCYIYFASARLVLPAVFLDVYAIVILNSEIRQIVAALQIDYSKPIATIQKQVEDLRILRIRSIQWTILAAPPAWVPFLIVILKGVFGLDAYHLFSAAWLLANLLFGLTLIPLAIWLSKRYGDRLGRWPVVQRLTKDLAGHSLNSAADFLATLSEFEAEKVDG